MGDIISLKPRTQAPGTEMLLTKVFCDDCGAELKFWLSKEEDVAYGICEFCHLDAPVSVSWTETIQNDQ